MKNIFKAAIFMMAMMFSASMAFGQNDDPEQTLDTNGSFQAYLEVTIPYTWLYCSRSGTITVQHYWSNDKYEKKYVSYKEEDKPEGKTYPIPMTDFGGTIVRQIIWVKSLDNGETNEYDGPYLSSHVIGPNPCSGNQNECRRMPDKVLCKMGPGGSNTD
jgi:hypothetical protein